MPRLRHQRFDCNPGCPVEATLSLIGGKWKGTVLWLLARNDVLRFNEIRRALSDVSQRTLTSQLRELAADGFIMRTVLPVVPPHVEYRLSKRGRSLEPVLLALKTWSEEHVDLAGPANAVRAVGRTSASEAPRVKRSDVAHTR